MHKPKRRRLRLISHILETPPDVFIRTSTVTLTSDCEALVTGCRRIKEYQCDRVTLSLCDCTVTFTGECLTMRTFFGSQILVCGKVTGVSYA